MATKTITNDRMLERIEDRLESLRLEGKQDINTAVATLSNNQGRLEKKLDDLERGTVSELQSIVTDLRIKVEKYEGNEGVVSSKVATLYGLGGGVFIIGSEVLLNWLTKR